MTPEAFTIAEVNPEGGGTIGICRMPGRNGAFDADMATILAWQPAVVVTLTEGFELAAHGAAKLGSILEKQGVLYRHFPIADFATPTTGLQMWEAQAADLHSTLDTGKRVLLHCLGGCGRSGMIALRLLVERGEDAGLALARLRAVRPCAVETQAQMAWANADLHHQPAVRPK